MNRRTVTMKKTLFSIARRTMELLAPGCEYTDWEVAKLARELRRQGVTPDNYTMSMVDDGVATFCVPVE